MDQLCSAIKNTGLCQMFKMSTSGHNSCPQPKSPPINSLINDRLSVNQTLPLLINISHRMLPTPIALSRFCNQQD